MVKFKNRYLLLEIVPDSVLAASDAAFIEFECYEAIWNAIGEIHGDYGSGASKQSLSVKVFNEETRILCVRITRLAEKILSSAIPFVKHIGRYPAILRTIHLGGSIRSCEKALLKYHRLRLVASLPAAKTIKEKQEIQALITRKDPSSESV